MTRKPEPGHTPVASQQPHQVQWVPTIIDGQDCSHSKPYTTISQGKLCGKISLKITRLPKSNGVHQVMLVQYGNLCYPKVNLNETDTASIIYTWTHLAELLRESFLKGLCCVVFFSEPRLNWAGYVNATHFSECKRLSRSFILMGINERRSKSGPLHTCVHIV